MKNTETAEITETSSKEGDSILIFFGWVFYVGALSCIGYGLTKIFKYKNYGENFSSLNVNAYVGGDAYNYIINGTYSTTYCVIGAVLAIIGSTCFIVNAIDKR
ncbi:hypothetical protein C8D76_103104 [Pasteurella langaaensis DSM 22999]|uniref:Uncharacterized protein n=1 Tax=Alitibacter langaaensis DSM 22999 TaxID=1122935 RepID=A0A2U0TA92_9PAST|nr:hypothetical protein [Pasteurella langaaensis]PVX40531.1 hypothetical protein C8D76_103104 [Pasteurella langaaensis DSM 22999]